MDFFTVSQTPYVCMKNNTRFFNLHVNNLDRSTPLKMFRRDNTERTVIPVFKCREDAMRFKSTNTSCYAPWKIEAVYPIDVNMSHLSLSSKIHHIPNELYDVAPFDLNDTDTILSLSLKAHIGFFIIGTFNVLANTVSMNGIVVDFALHDRFTDQEHMTMLQATYESIYLTTTPT